MKKLPAKFFVILFLAGLLLAGLKSCDSDYGSGYGSDYGDPYGGNNSEQLP